MDKAFSSKSADRARSGVKAKAGAGAAGFVIAAAVFGVIFSAAKAKAAEEAVPAAELSATISPATLGWSIPQAEAAENFSGDPHLIGPQGQRYLAWAAVAGILSSLVALVGANRILQWVAAAGAWLGRASSKAAESSVKAAKSAVKATAKVVGKPGRWLLTVAGLAVFALTGVAFLDIQWEVGLVAGAGIGAAAVWGWRKSGEAVEKAVAVFRPKQRPVVSDEPHSVPV